MFNLKSNCFCFVGWYVKLNTWKLSLVVGIHSLELGTALLALNLHKHTPGMWGGEGRKKKVELNANFKGSYKVRGKIKFLNKRTENKLIILMHKKG